MSLDPISSKSWQGFTDLLSPPAGFKLHSAVCTSFGLSFEALVTALLAMENAPSAAADSDALSQIIASTRLRAKVTVLVQAGSISGSTLGLPARLATLLDTMIVPIRIANGQFHPKLWGLCFAPVDKVPEQKIPDTDLRMRVVVGSRNLSASTCLELGASYDGMVGGPGIPLGQEVSNALAQCVPLMPDRNTEVITRTARAFRHARFETDSEGAEMLALHWQSADSKGVTDLIPLRNKRMVVVSPFITNEALRSLSIRTDELSVISTASALSRLSANAISDVIERHKQQQAPVLYAVREAVPDSGAEVGSNVEDSGDSQFDGIHAKMILTEDSNGKSMMILGSANATSRGLGISAHRNVECVFRMQPGIRIKTFGPEFMRDKLGALRPWLTEFQTSDLQDPTTEILAEECLTRHVQELAALKFQITYDSDTRVLTIEVPVTENSSDPLLINVVLQIAPLGVLEDATNANEDCWRTWEREAAPQTFQNVELSAVNNFIAIRATMDGQHWTRRIAQGELLLSGSDLSDRDDAARQHLLSAFRPEEILEKLILGLRHRRKRPGGSYSRSTATAGRSSGAMGTLSLEKVLQAIALNPSLADELRAFLGGRSDPEFEKLLNDLRQLS